MRKLIIVSMSLFAFSCWEDEDFLNEGTTKPNGPTAEVPTGTLTIQLPGGTVGGVVPIAVETTGDIVRVEMTLPGAVMEDTAPPFAFEWDTTAVPHATLPVTAKGYAQDGTHVATDTRYVTVDNATLTITQPAPDQAVSGMVVFAAEASDSVASVAFSVDDVAACSATQAPFSCTWDSTGATEGSHTLMAEGLDESGASSVSVVVPFEVDNLEASIAIVSPTAGPVSGVVTVQVSASTNIASVDVLLDGGVLGSDHAAPFEVNWDTNAVTGSHTLAARGLDSAGALVATSTEVVVTVDDDTTTPTTYYDAVSWQQVSNFGQNPGNLGMYMHVPEGMPENQGRPLVLALHGCQQDARTYASQSGWSEVADVEKVYVVYPEQSVIQNDVTKTGNQARCFNWAGYYGDDGDLVRGERSPASLVAMVDHMRAQYNVDDSQVFITGLSAGAAMSVVALATYPDVFAAGAINAGIPYHCATTVNGAYSCMGVTSAFMPAAGDDPGANMPESLKATTPEQWGDLVRGAYPGYTGPYPRVTIWHGDQDQYVDIDNLDELVEQWTNVHGVTSAPTTDELNGYAHQQFDKGGQVVVETVTLTGMTHGIAVDPGPAEDQGGEACTGMLCFSHDVDLFSTWHAYQFMANASSDRRPSVNVTAPADGAANLDGVVTISATASDDVGVTGIDLLVDGVIVHGGASTTVQFAWDTSGVADGAHTIEATAHDTAGQTGRAAITVAVRGALCREWTATNLEHVAAGRAESYTQYYVEYARTVGAGDDLGLLGTQWYSSTTSVRETSPGYFELGSCSQY